MNNNWEKELDKLLPSDPRDDDRSVKDFIRELLAAQKKEVVEMCKGMKKHVVENFPEEGGYNSALSDIISKLKE